MIRTGSYDARVARVGTYVVVLPELARGSLFNARAYLLAYGA